MSDTTTQLELPFLAQAQAQKHITVNESLLRLDALVQLVAVSATTSAQPGSPADGDIYILPSGKTGADWGAMANNALAYYRDGVWEQLTPKEGWRAYVKDTDLFFVFTGAAWSARVHSTGADTVTLKLEHTGGGADCEFEMYFNSPSPAANDVLAHHYYFNNASAAKILGLAINGVLLDPTAASEDTEYRFSTYVAGSLGNRLRIGGGVYHPSATGGDKGNNTINFGAVYDDNTLLTCGPVELMRTGAVDLEKWDALAPERIDPQTGYASRRHAVMHRFAAMLDEGFDPRDPENFCARLAADGAPPGLITEREWRERDARGERPDIGTMQTHTLLALDNIAVAFASLVARVAALEQGARRA